MAALCHSFFILYPPPKLVFSPSPFSIEKYFNPHREERKKRFWLHHLNFFTDLSVIALTGTIFYCSSPVVAYSLFGIDACVHCVHFIGIVIVVFKLGAAGLGHLST
ncbi:hypothetical protein BDF19DRAFT_434044 [Syncephalis fuscata]|nr:hypothetical protein BDF19DRAFT_434044 [Syncephalis fuscata]